ncbi:MAG: glycosyltransferase family 39 protein [Methanocella sp.]
MAIAGLKWFERIPDGAFFAGACGLYLAVALAVAALVGVFSGSVWSLGDTGIFFHMADVILQGGTPYVDFKDPKPPLIFFLLTLPVALGAGMNGGLLLVAIANFVSAVVIMAIGWRLYGRIAGVLAGLLFAASMTWAEGYFVLTEPFTVTFMVLSVYAMLFGGRHRYLIAGIGAGLAICFKQPALLMLPLSLFYWFRKGETKAFIPYLAGVALPLIAVFGAVFLLYGYDAGAASLYWSFGMAPTYISSGSVEGVSAFRIDDPLIAAAWVVLALTLFAPLLAMAVAGLVRPGRTAERELFALASLAFAATLAIRPFLHYWALALPFISLLVAAAFARPDGAGPVRLPRGRAVFYLAAGVAYAVPLLISSALTAIIAGGLWRPRAILEFYGLADIVLRATGKYFVYAPEPAAIRFAVDLPQVAGSVLFSVLLATAGLCLLSALAVTAVASRLYGRGPALLAGSLFTTSMAFTLGDMQLSDGVAILALVLSFYVMMLKFDGDYIPAGLLLGTAIAIKPLIVLLLPAIVLLMLRNGKPWQVPALAVCVLAPVSVVVLMATAGGPLVGVEWVTLPYAINPSAPYVVTDLLMAMLSLAAAGAFVATVLPAAAGAICVRAAGHMEECLAAATLLLLCSLFFGAFTHYWYVALPLASILAAGLLHQPEDGAKNGSGGKPDGEAV